MPEPLRVWIGIEDSGGIPRPERVDVPPPPHWRLEAIAATERPRSLTIAPDGRTAVFIQDRDTSDLWTLDLEGGALERLTTGRDPQPYWEDTQPACRRTEPRSRTATKAGSGSSPSPAARRASSSRRAARFGSVTTGSSSRSSATAAIGSPSSPSPTPGRSGCAASHGGLDAPRRRAGGDRLARRLDGRVRLRPALGLQPLRDQGRRRRDREPYARVTGAPWIRDHALDWSPDGTTLAARIRADRVVRAPSCCCRRVAACDSSRAGEADFSEARWHPGRRVARLHSRSREADGISSSSTPRRGEVTELARRRYLGRAALDGRRRRRRDLRRPGDAARAACSSCPGAEPRPLHRPAPLAVRVAPYVLAEELTYASFDGREIQAFLHRPAGRVGGASGARRRLPARRAG